MFYQYATLNKVVKRLAFPRDFKAENSLRTILFSLMLCLIGQLYAQVPDYSDKVIGGPEGGIVDKLDDELTVTPLGQLNYEIPIPTVPGTGGMSPKLSINYNSSTKNGLFGYGFDLTGLSIISRVPQNMFNDGKAGYVNFTSTDKFALDGARLMDVKTINATTYQYATEQNNFARVIAYGDKANPTSFTVETKDGLRYEYKPTYELVNYPPNQYESPYANKALFWVVTKVTDTKGNYFTVSYENGSSDMHDVYPVRIDYTGNANAGLAPYASVRFTYATDRYAPTTYVGGIAITRKQYITKIGIYNGERIQKYFDLSYNTINYRNQLGGITERTPYNNLTEHTVRFNWSNATNFKAEEVEYNQTSFIHKATLTIGDFNGDGKSDFIATPENKDAGWTGWKLFISTGKSFTNVANGSFYGDNMYDDKAQTPQIAAGDFNGDGYDDIAVLKKNTYGAYYTWLYTSVVSGTSVTFKQERCVNTESRQYTIRSIEKNGDGASDLFICYLNSKYGKILYGGSSLPLGSSSAHNSAANWNRVDFADFDGDGLTDIVNMLSSGVLVVNGVVKSGFYSGTNPIFGDFNGDGKTDILVADTAPGTNSMPWNILMSDGAGGFKAITTPSLFNPKDKQIFIMDVNGDGFDDFYAIDKTCKEDYKTTVTCVYLNKGNGNAFNKVDGAYTYQTDKWHFYMGDFNGDGKIDFVCTSDWKNSNWNGYQLFLMPEENNSLLTKIMDGLGNETNITYKNLTDPTVFQRGTTKTYPLVSVGLSWPVVYQVQTPNGIGGQNTMTYTYKNALMHKKGRGFLGFEYFITKDEARTITTTTQFEVEPTKYVMAVKYSETRIGGGYPSHSSTKNTLLDTGNKTFAYLPTATTQVEYSVRTGSHISNVSTTNEYDKYGNVTKSVSTINDTGGVVTTTVNTYINDESRWILGRLTDAVVTKTSSKYGTEIRHAKFEYDTVSGLLTAEYTEPENHELGYVKNYTHDVFGNIVRSTITPLDGSGPREDYTEYTNDGRYILSTTNSMGYTTTNTIDPDRGLLLSSKDPNGIVTTNTYDYFGRLTSSSTPLGTNKVTTGWCFNTGMVDAPTYALYFTYNQSTGTPYMLEFFDCLGRSVRKVTESLNGKKIYVDIVYNARGEVEKTSEPYFPGSTVYWNTNTYDSMSRLIAQKDAAGSITNIMLDEYVPSLGALATIITDPLGHRSIKTVDYNGFLIQSEDNEGNIIEYDYNVNGKCVSMTGPRTTINMAYDIMGNRTMLDDPDLGISTSTYNAYGELVSNTDSKGTTTYTYDDIGRVVSEVRPDVTTTTIYDINFIGEVAFVNSSNGTGIEYDNDRYGRITLECRVIDQRIFNTNYSYNALNKVDVITYPSGLKIKNNYSNNGILLSVTNADTGKEYWHLDKYNARGQIEQETFGNGLSTTTAYNPAKGYITDIDTPGVQDWSYVFDGIGNLTRRTDNARGLTETFDYDNLYRLLRVSRNGVPTQEMTYDGAGNITSKSDIASSYTYQDGNNRLSGVTLNPGATSSSGAHLKAWSEIRYSSFNKITYVNISSGDVPTTFTYGPDKSRVKMLIHHSGEDVLIKYYIGSVYEELIERSEVTELNYIFAAGKAVAIFETSSVTGTTLRYLHHDHLGSIMAYSDEMGKLAEELSYDAWGRRRDANTWEHYPYGSEYMSYFTAWNAHGFGGHEHLEVFDMINMDGRMYDPMLGRFLSPDPFVQAPDNPQSLNRYAYCMNNPLSLIDPSGYSWFSSNWKSLLSAAVGIAVSAIMPGVGPAVLSAVIAGAAGGAAGALTTSLLNGANLGQIAKATLTGAFWGAASGAANFLSGEGKDIIANIFKHTFSQGFLEGVQGGNIIHGFMMGAMSSIGGHYINKYGDQLGKIGKITGNAIVGGTASELGGGKFANGAITGAFAMMFNEMMHDGKQNKEESSEDVFRCKLQAKIEADGKLSLYEAHEWWQVGQGGTLNIDINSLDLGFLDISRMKAGNFQFTFPVGTDDWSVYGTLTGTVSATPWGNMLNMRNDTYDFDMKSNPNHSLKTTFRNIATGIGAIYHGKGTAYDINFYGTYRWGK